MRVLVTGGYGFLGYHLIQSLPADWQILNIDAHTYAATRFAREGMDVLETDLAKDWWFDRVKGFEPDLVLHLASESHVDNSISGPSVFVTSNVMGTLNLFESLRRCETKPRVIHMSTDEVLLHSNPITRGIGQHIVFDKVEEAFPDKWDIDHTAEVQPSSVYSATKAAQEMLCHAYRKTWGMDITIARSCNVYGPRQHREKFIPKTITHALLDRRIPVYGKGDQWRTWISTWDYCRAMGTIINKGGDNETYHISSEDEHQNIDVVKTILGILGKDEALIEHVEDRLGHDTCYSLSSQKLQSLGWKPNDTLVAGLNSTIAYYQRNLV